MGRASVSGKRHWGSISGGSILLALFAGGCAVAPSRPAVDWNQVRLERRALTHWNMTGRVAVATAQDGWSAATEWSQKDREFELQLHGAIGGGVRVRGDGESLEVETSKGEHFAGKDAALELENRLGVSLPLDCVRYWLLGVSAPGVAAMEQLDAQDRLAELDQSGWRIHYDRYLYQNGGWYPVRMRLEQNEVKLRVVVDHWRL
jgi:outer membrane lipoprotein LolB